MSSIKDFAVEKLETDSILKIENLIVGEGAQNFQKIESLTDIFCPFEAIGMVRQEIRHASFLSYILDSNRPHSFGVKLLEKFLTIIAQEQDVGATNFSRMDLHFMDLSNARVRREWKRIDLLIELPKSANMEKGIVLAIELKIDASESKNQLDKYKKTIVGEYSLQEWDHIFVFLTANEIDPSKGNEAWIPLGLTRVVDEFEQVVKMNQMSDPSAELFDAYIAMLRRHVLANETLEELVHKIWDKHKEALEVLITHRPDEGGNILAEIKSRQDKIADDLSKSTDLTVKLDTSSKSISRYCVEKWGRSAPEMLSGDGSWVESNNILAIELKRWGGLNFSLLFCIGPGNQDNRAKLYKAVQDEVHIKIGRNTTKVAETWKVLSSTPLLGEKLYKKLYSEGKNESQIVDEMINIAVTFLKDQLPHYDNAIQVAFSKD